MMNELIEGIQNSEVDALKTAYNNYHEKLYFFVLKISDSPYIAEEVVQQTFIKLWENRSSLSVSNSLSSQIFRIGKSILIDTLRKSTREKESHKNLVLLTPVEEDGEQKIIYREKWEMVNQQIEMMPPIRKKIFKLSRIEGLSYKEIATELSISPRTVENHIALALKQLKGFAMIILLLHI